MRAILKKIWRVAIAAGACLALAGCQTDPAIVLLERDNRLKEDEINRLRWRVRDMEEAMQAGGCGMPAAMPATRIAPAPLPPTTQSGPDLGTGGQRPSTFAPPPRTSPGRTNGTWPPTVPGEPKVEPGQEVPPGEPPPLRTPAGKAAPWAPLRELDKSEPLRAPTSSMRARGLAIPVAAIENAGVTRITLPESRSGGEGELLVTVQPRDARGQILDAPGNISVVLLDPALPEASARLARWDFTAAQTAEMLDGGERGIQLRLAWPDAPPTHSRLQVFVRYTTRDGRRLDADRPIEVSLPTQRLGKLLPSSEGPALLPVPEQGDSWRAVPRPATPARRPEWSPERS